MSASLRVDRVVAGRYRLIRPLGRGGRDPVWLADDQQAGRQVAVKELRPPGVLAADERQAFGRRALAEARDAARVRHPNAVELYDAIPADGDDDAVCLIMELVKAPTLAELIARDGPLPARRVESIAWQLLDVLDTAHALGVVHRDVAPANILVGAGDRVKLTDFGIAHADADTRLTRSGNVMSSQVHMAPELFGEGEITAAADMWSLGATLFHAVMGTAAFQRDSAAATLNAILLQEPPRAACPRPLADAISALLVRDPTARATTQQVRGILGVPAQPPGSWPQTGGVMPPTAGIGSRPGTQPRPPLPKLRPITPPLPVKRRQTRAWALAVGGCAAMIAAVVVTAALHNAHGVPSVQATPSAPPSAVSVPVVTLPTATDNGPGAPAAPSSTPTTIAGGFATGQ